MSPDGGADFHTPVGGPAGHRRLEPNTPPRRASRTTSPWTRAGYPIDLAVPVLTGMVHPRCESETDPSQRSAVLSTNIRVDTERRGGIPASLVEGVVL